MKNLILAVTSDFSNMKRVMIEAEKRDMHVHYTYSINEAVEMLADKDYKLVAINADGIDYMSKLQILRELKPMPIIVFSYTFDVSSERVRSLRMGADVFIATPFALEYIIESGLALIRMYDRLGGQKRLKPGSILAYGHILLSTQTRTVFVKGEEVLLSKREFDVLYCLMREPGHVFTYEQIFKRIAGYDDVDNIQKVIYNHIYILRKKLKVSPDIPEYIVLVKDFGYKLSLNSDTI